LFSFVRLLVVSFPLGFVLLHSVRGAESPQRFLQATQWIAQLSRDVTDNGMSVVEDCEIKWDLTTKVDVQIRMIKPSYAGSVPIWEGVETQSYTGSGHERFTQICQSGSFYIAEGRPASSKPEPSILLNIDPVANTYSLSLAVLDVPWEGTLDFSGFVIPQPETIFFWSGDASGEIERPLPATGMVLEGQDSYPLKMPPIVHTSSWGDVSLLVGFGQWGHSN
jgi:hypothetical protein